MNLKEEIKKLVQLQEIDSRIYNLQQEKDVQKPAELEKLRVEFEEIKQKFNIFEEKVKELQLKRKDREIELGSKEENLKKSQAQLYQLKTNKEYQAKLTEIGSTKADISLAEEEVLKVLDGIEDAKKEFESAKERLNQQEKVFKDQEGKTTERIKDVAIEIQTLQDKRRIFTSEIDVKILSQYEQLLKTRQGLAVVPLSNDDCGACHLKVTHQKINEIKMYDKLALCESCVRILYVPEDIE